MSMACGRLVVAEDAGLGIRISSNDRANASCRSSSCWTSKSFARGAFEDEEQVQEEEEEPTKEEQTEEEQTEEEQVEEEGPVALPHRRTNPPPSQGTQHSCNSDFSSPADLGSEIEVRKPSSEAFSCCADRENCAPMEIETK